MTNYTGNKEMDLILNSISNIGLPPKGEIMKTTEFTFEVKGKVSVTLFGSDTDDNYEKALDKAVEEAKKEIDAYWLDYVTAKEYADEIYF